MAMRRSLVSALRPALRPAVGAAPRLAARAVVRPLAARAAAVRHSHSDFAPQHNASAVEDVAELIKQEVTDHGVVLFMKGVPEAPMCGFSNMVVQILRAEGLTDFRSHNVLADEELRQGIKAYSDWPTIPQLYIGGEFVGGCDIVKDMFESGDLTEALKEVSEES